MQLVAICYKTNTPQRCLNALLELWILNMGSEPDQDITDAAELMHSKGNLFILEGRDAH